MPQNVSMPELKAHDLKALIAELVAHPQVAPDGTPRALTTTDVRIGAGLLAAVGDFIHAHAPKKEVLVVADPETMAAAGDAVEAALDAAGFNFGIAVLQDENGASPEADIDVVESVLDALDEEVELVVAVGSGTINDICKLAAFRAKIPYVVVATAPSMNGYTSAIAAMTDNGLKTTVPCRAPVGVLADTTVLAAAPREMIHAGLGDLMSKPVSSADWKLSTLVGGGAFWEVPNRVSKQAFQEAVNVAASIGRRDTAAIETLTQGLILSGFSMVLAGSSSPASGGEHLISHYWDMMAPHDGRTKGLHGLQVALGTLLTAVLYEKLKTLDPTKIDIDGLVRDHLPPEAYKADLKQRQPELFEAIEAEAMRQYLAPEAFREHLASLVGRWPQIIDAVSPFLLPPAMLRETLTKAGVPTNADNLGLSRSDVFRALIGAHEIRARYTVLHLANDLGLLPGLAEDIIDEAGLFV